MIPLGRSIATILIPAFLLYWHRGAGRRREPMHTLAPGFKCTEHAVQVLMGEGWGLVHPEHL